MRARDLALLLLAHPDAAVMVIDPTDPTDFDYMNAVRYNPQFDRFHLGTTRDIIEEVLSGIERME